MTDGILVHQSNYTQKVLERFGLENHFPLKPPWSEDHCKQIKIPIDLEKRGRKYWDRNSQYSAEPTKRHLKGVKNILRYLQGSKDMGLFYRKNQDLSLVGYADAGYLSDPHTAKSQTGYVFLCGGTAISWKSSKQSLVSTSTNHSEIIALYEAAQECA